jgi:NO-binding membrane sensor protein with MHYT domain
MATLHQFTYGVITPILAYALSFLGSLLGLVATSRARASRTRPQRARWLVLAAWAIGGTGIWVMHFMAMLGFSVSGSAVRFDVQMTIASWLTAILVVGAGLFIVGYGRPSVLKLIAGGPLTGLGVGAMHYTGMDAMHVSGSVGYDRQLVILSLVIAVVAATVALWFTLVVHKPAALVLAAAIMGVAVTGMHYTGMYAMRVHLHDAPTDLAGVDPMAFLVPILVFVILVAVALTYALLATPSKEDQEFEDTLTARVGSLPMPTSVPPTSSFIPATSSFIPAKQNPSRR